MCILVATQSACTDEAALATMDHTKMISSMGEIVPLCRKTKWLRPLPAVRQYHPYSGIFTVRSAIPKACSS